MHRIKDMRRKILPQISRDMIHAVRLPFLLLWYAVSRLILKIFTVKVLQKSVQQISNMQKLWDVPSSFWHPATKLVEVIPAWWHHLCFPQNIHCVG